MAAPHKDIADFYINIRDKNNIILIEEHVPYDRRNRQIIGNDISSDYSAPLQLCVQAKKSDGSIGSWFDTQCQNLPSNFEEVKKRYNENRDGVFTIISSKAQRNNERMRLKSGSMKTFIPRVLLMGVLCVQVLLLVKLPF